MELATSSVLACYRPGNTQLSVEQSIKLAKEAGFQYFDINFWDWSRPGMSSPFLTDEWNSWADRIAAYADNLGVKFVQGHAYTYAFLDAGCSTEEREYHEKLTMRSIECCDILGVETLVVHPDTDWNAVRRMAVSKEKNIEYFKRMMEKTTKKDRKLAVENMCNSDLSFSKYGSNAEELIDLVDRFQDRRIGICWDFEHGAIMEVDQYQTIREIDQRLLATHVSDTHSKTDTTVMHILPLLGEIDWKPIMRALSEIKYDGYFSYEVSNYTEHMPDHLLLEALRFGYQIGQYLLSLSGGNAT